MSELFGEVKKDFSQKAGSTRVWLCANVHAVGTRLTTAKWHVCGWEESLLNWCRLPQGVVVLV